MVQIIWATQFTRFGALNRKIAKIAKIEISDQLLNIVFYNF